MAIATTFVGVLIALAAKKMFIAYNEQGPNPWKTHSGAQVPGWDELGPQVQAKWIAAAEKARAIFTGSETTR